MRAPQQRALPRSSSQENTGTLSRAAIWAPQAGHWERGPAIEMPRGTRWATAVAKLPAASPTTNAIRAPASIDAELYPSARRSTRRRLSGSP